jgi:hypothetical protein
MVGHGASLGIHYITIRVLPAPRRNTMTIQELFVASNQALAKSVASIGVDQWELAMPAAVSYTPSTLKQAVAYHTYDDAWVPSVLAGKTIADVGNDFEYLLTADSDIAERYQTFNLQASEAVQRFTSLEEIVHVSYGDFPARDYLQHVISFRAFRAYDIAKLIGADTIMPDDLVAALMSEFTPVIETYRQMGVFPPAVKVSEEASLQTKLLAMVGRD